MNQDSITLYAGVNASLTSLKAKVKLLLHQRVEFDPPIH
jgi:hypothetical protein